MLTAMVIAACLQTATAFDTGLQAGYRLCQEEQLHYALQPSTLPAWVTDPACDDEALAACRNGFSGGFRETPPQTIAGVSVPGCLELLHAHWDGIEATYESVRDEICRLERH